MDFSKFAVLNSDIISRVGWAVIKAKDDGIYSGAKKYFAEIQYKVYGISAKFVFPQSIKYVWVISPCGVDYIIPYVSIQFSAISDSTAEIVLKKNNYIKCVCKLVISGGIFWRQCCLNYFEKVTLF